MKWVREEITWLDRSGEGHPTASSRWLGRRPDGPGANPLGNDFIPFWMVSSESLAGEGTVQKAGREAQPEDACSASLEKLQERERPDHQTLMALLYCPFWTACLALRMLLEEEVDSLFTLRAIYYVRITLTFHMHVYSASLCAIIAVPYCYVYHNTKWYWHKLKWYWSLWLLKHKLKWYWSLWLL